MVEAIQRAFEGNSLQVDIVGEGSPLHQGADEIVSDPMHGQFFEDHTGCEAAQYIQAKYSFDLSEVQFDVPAPEIEFFQLMGRIELRIEQRGRENDLLGAKPRDGDCKSYQSQGEGCRQLVIVFFAPVGQTLGWFAPQHQPIIFTEPATAAKVRLATALMQPHEAVDAPPQQLGDIQKGTKCAIGQQDLAGF